MVPLLDWMPLCISHTMPRIRLFGDAAQKIRSTTKKKMHGTCYFSSTNEPVQAYRCITYVKHRRQIGRYKPHAKERDGLVSAHVIQDWHGWQAKRHELIYGTTLHNTVRVVAFSFWVSAIV